MAKKSNAHIVHRNRPTEEIAAADGSRATALSSNDISRPQTSCDIFLLQVTFFCSEFCPETECPIGNYRLQRIFLRCDVLLLLRIRMARMSAPASRHRHCPCGGRRRASFILGYNILIYLSSPQSAIPAATSWVLQRPGRPAAPERSRHHASVQGNARPAGGWPFPGGGDAGSPGASAIGISAYRQL